jgi:16S rRNA processing protein RimM
LTARGHSDADANATRTPAHGEHAPARSDSAVGRSKAAPAHGEPVPADGQSAPAEVPAGRVGRPHGLDGSFYVTGPRPRLLALGGAVNVAGRSATIVRRSGTEQRPIVRLRGIEDRAAAEALRGAELTVSSGAAPALEQGEWWAHELEGCEVRDGDVLLGTVSRLVELPSCEALEVTPAHGGGEALLVPMVKDAIRSVQPQQRYIEVNLDFLDLPEGSP